MTSRRASTRSTTPHCWRVRGIGSETTASWGAPQRVLKAGVLAEDGVARDTRMGTPQGGVLWPLLANIALSVLDDHFAVAWQRDMATRHLRERRRR